MISIYTKQIILSSTLLGKLRRETDNVSPEYIPGYETKMNGKTNSQKLQSSLNLPYNISGKFSREKTFVNFVVLGLSAKFSL